MALLFLIKLLLFPWTLGEKRVEHMAQQKLEQGFSMSLELFDIFLSKKVKILMKTE